MSVLAEVKLSDLCLRTMSGGTPARSVVEYYRNGTIPWLKTGEVKKRFIWDTEEKITQRGLAESSAKLIPPKSIIVAMYGDGDTAGTVAINMVELATNQACCNFIIDKEKANYRFLYYYLKASYGNLTALKLGGSQQNLNAASLKSFPIRAPNVCDQNKIAAVLSAYDDLIENNRRRIALLERMAEQLYREWFVRFRFPGYRRTSIQKGVPAGWHVRKLPALAEIAYGFPFAGNRFNTDGLGKPIVRIRNVPAASTSDFTDEVASDKYLIRSGDLLIGMDGEFHMNHWHGDEAYLVQRVCRIRAKKPEMRAYLYWALRAPIKHLEATIVGATVAHLGAKHLNAIDLLVPEGAAQGAFEPLNDLLDQKLALVRINDRLAKTRDLLLPRLISGKLRVDDLDIQFPPSMQVQA